MKLRSLFLAVAGALLLVAAFVPRANACENCNLLVYYNFEGTPTTGFPVNMTSKAPGALIGLQLMTDYPANELSSETGIALNVAPGDLQPNLTGLGLSHSGQAGARHFDTSFPSFGGTVFYDVTCVSFAINALGNGFTSARVGWSLDGGATFTFTAAQVVPTAGSLILDFDIPSGTTVSSSNLVIRIELSGGKSNGADVQNILDNIQICGTAVPEPATVAGGLLGVLGLCWHQRRRLIRSVRFRRA
jgi:hypothetical protein